MAVGWANLRFQAYLPAMIGEPFRARGQAFLVLWLRRDAGEAQELAQLGDETGLVAFEVIEHDLHGD